MSARHPSIGTNHHLWMAEARATLALAWPLIATNLAQVAINATDVVMMGWLGPEALASGALGSNLYFAVMIFGIGVVTAAAPMASAELGRRSHSVRDVRRTIRQAFWAAATLCLPFWLVLWQTESILILLGQETALAARAASYTRAMQWALLPTFLYVVLRIFISALERPRWALMIGSLAIPFNAFANWCLMFGNLGMPALGLQGAGVGSVLTGFFMLGAMALVVVTDRRFRRYHLFGRFWRADWSRYRELWRLGLPIGMTLAFEVLVFNAAVLLMGLFGATALAAHSIALQIAAISFMVPLGFSQAVTVRVGRALGAGDRDAITRAGWTPLAMGVTFMATMGLLMILFPHTLIGIFLDRTVPENAEVIRLAVSFLAIAALFQVFDGAQAIAAGMLRGLQDTRMPMIYAGIGYWIIGLSSGILLAFPYEMEGVGIWLGLATGLAAVSVLMIFRWQRRERLGLDRPLWQERT
ncbi:MAG: MATE family efflux transporter [Parvibaculum sp.]|uniref:MATE family efflux transporter n=2 Tax=Parvibaculum sp. TaxID=2024848 RepID=UPI001B2AEA30|nr:MATE family efflux transporter [Parvibaculum sp.]MBO6634376.1 MATE family efflux transporter [Parvibaculum sp.]MBO6676995.1 MATE family efflux transporter [Parvibaculum sp.]MBO6683481.1 MATE family efflux transporter [Parvibaculum sp.]MBO6905582.1 MATE family efflux transporter [Parvibaculum sp.]